MTNRIHRAAIIASIGVLLVLGAVVARAQSQPEALVFVLITAAVMATLAYLMRGVMPVNPFGVFFLLALVAGIIWLGIELLQLIGPVGTIALTIVLLAIVSVATYRRGEKRRAHRELAGLCIYCGYDLRATENRCPECGAHIEGELLRRRRIFEELKAKREQVNPTTAVNDDIQNL